MNLNRTINIKTRLAALKAVLTGEKKIMSDFHCKKIILDACSMCQLRCLACHNAEGAEVAKKSINGWGYLKFENFKNFIDSNPRIKQIELSGRGEFTLNPQLDSIIKYAHKKKVSLSASNGSNFNSVSENVLESFVKYEFKNITISIDGASTQTYKLYRRGGNFDRVIANIKKLNEFKEKYNSELPELTWQFVIFGHNEHEIPIAKKMAKELNMSFKPKLNWSKEFSPVKNKEFVRQESGLGAADRKEFKDKNKKEYMLLCTQLWKSPGINWDGKLIGCCVNKTVSFGNVFESGLDACLSSKKYNYMKKVVLGQAPNREDLPCFKCANYLKIDAAFIQAIR